MNDDEQQYAGNGIVPATVGDDSDHLAEIGAECGCIELAERLAEQRRTEAE